MYNVEIQIYFSQLDGSGLITTAPFPYGVVYPQAVMYLTNKILAEIHKIVCDYFLFEKLNKMTATCCQYKCLDFLKKINNEQRNITFDCNVILSDDTYDGRLIKDLTIAF